MLVSEILAQAISLHGAGRIGEAAQLYRAILQREQQHADALHLLGVAFSDMGRPAESIDLIGRAIQISSDQALYHSNLGNALKRLGRGEEAAGSYRRAVALAPGVVPILTNLGGALVDEGEGAAAERTLWRTIAHDFNYADAWFALGSLAALADDDRAEARFARALALEPAYAEAWFNRANHLRDRGRFADAVRAYDRAIALKPEDDDPHSNLIFALCFMPESDAARQSRASRRWGRMAERNCGPAPSFANSADPERRLTIAYLSPDLRRHQFLMQLRPLWAHHDRHRFRVLGYAEVARPDDDTERLRAMADGWRDIAGLDDDAVAAAARADGVDIMVSVTGYLARDRRRFACRKAPIQIAALNHVTATGLSAIDARITDRWLDPPGDGADADQDRLLRLDAGFAVFEPPQDAPAVEPLPADRSGHVTLGSFNNLTKLTPETLTLWARILDALPEARLLVKAIALSESGPRRRLTYSLAEAGIDRERVRYLGRVPAARGHLAALGSVDIALDPLPFTGGLSSAEVLWMGVPIVTLAGNTLVARQGASMLVRVGLETLVAGDPETYVRIAVGLARDPSRLRRLRADLRQQIAASPLADGRDYARQFEAACRGLWREWCRARSEPALNPRA